MNRKFFYKDEITLSPSGYKLIDYIEASPKQFINSTISDVARAAFISTSNISKIAKKLGFSSFKNLQTWIASEFNNLNEMSYVANATSFQDITSNIKFHYLGSIQRTIFDINISKFRKLKKTLQNVTYTYTFGIGSSSLAAIEMAHALNIVGEACTKLDDVHSIFQNINQKNKNRVCLIIYSNSLSSQELTITRLILAKHNVAVFIFTSNYSTNIHPNETFIWFRTIEQKRRIIAMSSKISQLLLTDIFINWYGKSHKNRIYNDFSQTWRKNK